MTVTGVDLLVDGLLEFLRTGEDRAGVVAEDVFADFNVPYWRYQLLGRDAVGRQLKDDAPHGCTVQPGRVVPTGDGLALEVFYDVKRADGGTDYYRTVWLVTVQAGRVTELVLYCTGAWDEETVRRQAAEAPMFRA